MKEKESLQTELIAEAILDKNNHEYNKIKTINGYGLIKALVNTIESEIKIKEYIYSRIDYITDNLTKENPGLENLDSKDLDRLTDFIDLQDVQNSYRAFTLGFDSALTMLGYKPLFNDREATK